jgi:3-oxoacyl-[acyl-carrier protein] reductase
VTSDGGRLRGRVGLITGAASGIGAAGAELFAAHGAALVLLDVDRDGGQRVAGQIAARSGRAVFVPGDAASPDDVAGAVRTAVDQFGHLDLLWANAGTGVAKTVPETTLAEWERVLAVNLTGAFLLARSGIPELAAAGGGTMVITGSAKWSSPARRTRSWPSATGRRTARVKAAC